jgi:hypothetical protein
MKLMIEFIRTKKNAAPVLAWVIASLLMICTLASGNCAPFDWMDKRIRDDLRAFKTISIKELDRMEESFLGNSLPFMRLKIDNGNLSYTSFQLEPAHLTRIEGYIHYLEKMQLAHPLPDSDLMIFLCDGVDESMLNNINAPIFCGAKTKQQSKVIVIPELFIYPTMYQMAAGAEKPQNPVRWSNKIGIGYWRGSTTGDWYTLKNWENMLRTKFVRFSQTVPKLLDCAFSRYCQGDPEVEQVMRGKNLFKEEVNQESQLIYKYLIAIDGNTCASSLKWQLFTNSVVLKNDSDWIEWYDTALIPFKHYVPFKSDFSDLPKKLKWLKKHDKKARMISMKGRAFARKNLTEEGLELYMRKLLAAYSARLRP